MGPPPSPQTPHPTPFESVVGAGDISPPDPATISTNTKGIGGGGVGEGVRASDP